MKSLAGGWHVIQEILGRGLRVLYRINIGMVQWEDHQYSNLRHVRTFALTLLTWIQTQVH